MVLVCPDQHPEIAICKASELCTVDIFVIATFSTVPPMFKMDLSMIDPFTLQADTFSALGRDDIRWVTEDWMSGLRGSLKSKVVSKLHRHNKFLAVWQARKLIQGWAKGSVSMGPGTDKIGFLNGGGARIALLGLGMG